MRIESPGPGILRVTLHAYELSALVAAARCVAEGAEGETSPEARDRLRDVLESYDDEVRRLASNGPRAAPSQADSATMPEGDR